MIALLIPAHRPGEALAHLVQGLLRSKTFGAVLVIDDGSGPAFGPIFAGLSQQTGVQVLRHAVNLGKGAALKTGLNHLLTHHPEIAGVVTADADGQHHPEDIAGVAAALASRSRT